MNGTIYEPHFIFRTRRTEECGMVFQRRRDIYHGIVLCGMCEKSEFPRALLIFISGIHQTHKHYFGMSSQDRWSVNELGANDVLMESDFTVVDKHCDVI